MRREIMNRLPVKSRFFITLATSPAFIRFNTALKEFVRKTDKRYYKIIFDTEKKVIEFVLTDNGLDFNVYPEYGINMNQPFHSGLSRNDVVQVLLDMGFNYGRIPVEVDSENEKFIISLDVYKGVK